ncbi:MAG: glycosyltransferase [Actinobacteria bacterium]|nr:glycosyltransferase [Actinomycetota bacterium]
MALFYGERSGGIRTYLAAKAAWAQKSGLIEHHVIVPGRWELHEAGRHELPSLRLMATNGYRLPLGAGALKDTLRELRPDVVVLHDPFWRPLGVTRTAHDLGATVLAVHHGSTALDAAALPGPDGLWRPLLRAWMHHAYRDADAIMSAVDARVDCGRSATIPLRFGIDPVFVPQPAVRRHDHVLYVGRLGREKGVIELLHAAARSAEPWQLKIVGRGPLEHRIRRLAKRLGIDERVRMYPFIADRARLARWYAGACVVVMAGAHETFGLTAFEAAATGTPVVTCTTAPSAALMPALVRTYEPGDIDGLLAAIETARAGRPAEAAGTSLGKRCSWGAAFAAETVALERLTRSRERPLAVAG